MRQQQPNSRPATAERVEGSAGPAVQEADLAYRRLGMALGRGSRESSLFRPVFRAGWDGAQKSIELPDLPKDVGFLELRQGSVSEVLPVVRDPKSGRARVTPVHVTSGASIDSLVGLREPGGPVLSHARTLRSPASSRARKAPGA